MKIAFRRTPGFFSDLEFARLRERLRAHELLDWTGDDDAPASDLDVLFVVGTLEARAIEKQSRVFFIQTASAGYEGIDVDAATERGIWVSAAPAAETGNAVSVGREVAVMLMIGASRRAQSRAIASVHDRALAPDHLATALSGKTACIVGLGSVGRAVVERLPAFGMTLVATDEHPEHAPPGIRAYGASALHEAVREADYVVVCAAGKRGEREAHRRGGARRDEGWLDFGQRCAWVARRRSGAGRGLAERTRGRRRARRPRGRARHSRTIRCSPSRKR